MTAVNFDLIGRDRGASTALDKVARKADDTGRKFGFLAARSHGLTAGMTTGFGKIAAAMGAVATISVFKGFIDEARESGRVSRITANVIKQTGGAAKVTAGHVGDLATQLSNKAGVDDEVIQTGANLLLTFKSVRNEIGKGNQVFDRATAAAVDLSAAGFGSVDNAAKMLGKALNDPLKGLTALGRAGVTFTDQQKNQIKTLVESGRTLEAQKIILQEVESQVGGAAKAAADPMARLAVVTGNVKEQLGTALLPVVERVSTFLADHLPQAGAAAGRAFEKVGEGIEAVLPFAKTVVTAFTGVGKKIVDAIGEVDLTGIGRDIAAGAKAWAEDIIGGVKSGLESGDWRPLGRSLGNGLISALRSTSDVADKLGGAIEDLVGKVDWARLGTKVTGAITGMFASVDWGRIGDALGDAAVQIVTRSDTLGDKLGTAFSTFIKSVDWEKVGYDSTSAIVDFIKGVDWGTVAKVFAVSVIGSLKISYTTYQAVINSAGDLAKGVVLKIGEELFNAKDWLKEKSRQTGKDLISGLKSGVVSAVSGIGQWMKRVIVDPVVNWVKSGFGVRSPSIVFAGIGRDLINGLKAGILAAAAGIGGWITRNVVTPLLNAFNSAGGWLQQEGRDVISGFLTGLSARWQDVKRWVGGIATWIKDNKGPVSLDARLLIPAGRAIMSGFLQGLQSGAGKAWDFVKSVGGKTVGELQSAASFIGQGFKPNANSALGKQLAAGYGWTGASWQALYRLWANESGWNNLADNPTSTAFGIPQFIAGTARQYGVYGVTDPGRQIAAGLRYIRDAYGNPQNALNAWLSRSPHWYEKGTNWVPNTQLAVLHKGEAVIPAAVNRRARMTPRRTGEIHIHLHGTEQQLMNQLSRKLDDLRRQGRL